MATVEGLNEMLRKIDAWETDVLKTMEYRAKNEVAPMLANYAKRNRPWTDRTGKARRSLHSKVEMKARYMAIQLHHGVYYGLFLEMSKAGRYAILKPTIEQNRNLIGKILSRPL